MYMTTDLKTGKIYIGEHKIRCDNSQDPWYFGSGNVIRAIQTKRREDLTRDILEVCDNAEDAYRLEEFFINIYDATNPAIGYNISGKGHGSDKGFRQGHEVSIAVREKLRQYNLGRKASDETRAKLSAMRKGQKHSDKWVENIRKSLEKLQKPVLNCTTGKAYPSVTVAAKEYGGSHSNLVSCLKGRYKTFAKCEWKYIEQENEIC